MRFFYLIYYLKHLDRKKFHLFLNYASGGSKGKNVIMIADSIYSVFRYNISIFEYFQFKFYEKDHPERSVWTGTGYMYEYQKLMNPKKSRKIIENKILFLNYFKNFVHRKFENINNINEPEFTEILSNSSGKTVLKNSLGQVGGEVEIIENKKYTSSSLFNYMKSKNYDLIEEFVIQHPVLMRLSPTGLNTIRIITQLNNNQVDLIGARLRISVNSAVDNMGAGNMAAPVDIKTGFVSGPGVYSDITKTDEEIHPVTGVEIRGFKIPYWKESIEMIKEAALIETGNRSVGWDIAITNEGPELIEGNHNWCKLLWQLPVKKGMKPVLEKYRKEFIATNR